MQSANDHQHDAATWGRGHRVTRPGLRTSIVPHTLALWASVTKCYKFESVGTANGHLRCG
jgi:hypothetical protein